MYHDDERDHAEERANRELHRDDPDPIVTLRATVGDAIARAYRELAAAGIGYATRIELIGEALANLTEDADYATGRVG